MPVITVLGNHEYYVEELHSFQEECRDRASGLDGVYLLEDDVIELGGVRFLGCTLWSDFEASDDPLMARIEAQARISDYEVIKVKRDCGNITDSLSPLDTIKPIGLAALSWNRSLPIHF